MEHFSHIGEVLGSLRALMVLEDNIQINQRQCSLLLDIFNLAFNTIADQIQHSLKLEEKNTKWRVLDQPLKELYRIFKEGELYVKHCLDAQDWWGKAISLHQNRDAVEFHVHNLLTHFPAVIEAIETAGEISGLDVDEMQKRRFVLAKKYDKFWNDSKLFRLRFGKEYLVSLHICNQLDNAWKEDRWLLIEDIQKKKKLGPLVFTKNEQQLADVLLSQLNTTQPSKSNKIFPSWVLTGGQDYQVRRRLGRGNQYKEIKWLGEHFAMRRFFAELTQPLNSEISALLTLSHPNILRCLCWFYDEERKEHFLVMELMTKNLSTYMREFSSPRRRFLFSLPVVVDFMLQIARGMEYLHSQKIYHGYLNPSNVLLKPRSSPEGYLHAKVMGYGLSSIKCQSSKSTSDQNAGNSFIWYAPEVLAEQERLGCISDSKHADKADVYSYGMLCFQLLTGKLPFEDSHLQGEKIIQNIRAGERPLFPSLSPKYLVSLTRKCWQADPAQRPTFSSICRILRYVKKFLVLNPDHIQHALQLPSVDFCDIEATLNKSLEKQNSESTLVSQIPYEIFAFSLVEKEKEYLGFRERSLDSGGDAISISICRDDNIPAAEDPSVLAADFALGPASDTRSLRSAFQGATDVRSVCSEAPIKKMLSLKRSTDVKAERVPGILRSKSAGLLLQCARTNQRGQLSTVTGRSRQTSQSRDDTVLATKHPSLTVGLASDAKPISSTIQVASDARSTCSEAPVRKLISLRKSTDTKARKVPGLPRSASIPCGAIPTTGLPRSASIPCGSIPKSGRRCPFPRATDGSKLASPRKPPVPRCSST